MILEGLYFGPEGVPHSAALATTVSSIERLKELDLDALEIEFKTGVDLTDVSAGLVKQTATNLGIRLSAHAPYFIDFNSRDKETRNLSQQKLIDAARITHFCGGHTVIFHPAFYVADTPQKTYQNVKKRLQETVKRLREETPEVRVSLRPELTGKGSQFGSLEEIIELSAEVEGIAPALNFSHLHSRTGRYNSYPEFLQALRLMEDRLGRPALEDIYVLVGGITYGKGKHAKVDRDEEWRHVNLEESEFNYCELLHALHDFKAQGTVICESPNREEDALSLKATFYWLGKGLQCAQITPELRKQFFLPPIPLTSPIQPDPPPAPAPVKVEERIVERVVEVPVEVEKIVERVVEVPVERPVPMMMAPAVCPTMTASCARQSLPYCPFEYIVIRRTARWGTAGCMLQHQSNSKCPFVFISIEWGFLEAPGISGCVRNYQPFEVYPCQPPVVENDEVSYEGWGNSPLLPGARPEAVPCAGPTPAGSGCIRDSQPPACSYLDATLYTEQLSAPHNSGCIRQSQPFPSCYQPGPPAAEPVKAKRKLSFAHIHRRGKAESIADPPTDRNGSRHCSDCRLNGTRGCPRLVHGKGTK